jgi:gas vesicle protein
MRRRRREHKEEVPYIVVERHDDASLGPFLWGALIGAGIALLFAPRSGRETRENITQGAMRLKDAAEDTVRTMQESVTGAVDNVRTQVGGGVQRARSAIDAGRSAARESRADMERRIREARAGFESGVRAARAGRGYDEVDVLDEDDEI